MSETTTPEPEAIEAIEVETPTQRTVLLIWSELFGDDLRKVLEEPISIGVANHVVASWPRISYQETQRYHELYHQVLLDLGDYAHLTLAANLDSLGWVGEDDGKYNHEVYKGLLVEWQLHLDHLESEWRATDPESHIWVAVIASARAMVFSQQGLVGHLDTIGFTMDDGEFVAAVQASLAVGWSPVQEEKDE